MPLHRHHAFNERVRVVAFKGEIFVVEIKNVGHIAVNHHSRQRARGAAQLQVHLLHVVEVDVGIAERVDKITRLQPGHLRHHHQQQGITGNIERHAQK